MPDDKDWAEHVYKEMGRFGDKLDRVEEHQDKTNELLGDYNAELQKHIAGVEALDQKTDIMREQHVTFQASQATFKTDVEERLDIAEQPIKWVQTTISMLKGLAISVGAVLTLYGAYTQLF